MVASRSHGCSKRPVPNIYAIGDVTHRHQPDAVAIRDCHAFADTVFGKRPSWSITLNIPTACFSQPEVERRIGRTEARAQFSHVDI